MVLDPFLQLTILAVHESVVMDLVSIYVPLLWAIN